MVLLTFSILHARGGCFHSKKNKKNRNATSKNEAVGKLEWLLIMRISAVLDSINLKQSGGTVKSTKVQLCFSTTNQNTPSCCGDSLAALV